MERKPAVEGGHEENNKPGRENPKNRVRTIRAASEHVRGSEAEAGALTTPRANGFPKKYGYAQVCKGRSPGKSRSRPRKNGVGSIQRKGLEDKQVVRPSMDK